MFVTSTKRGDYMTIDEEIMKLDLIASDAFEGGNKNEFIQLAEWLRELELYRETLIGRPCEVCKFHETGSCSRWDCVFEEVNADDSSRTN